jgi:hypothetical protein
MMNMMNPQMMRQASEMAKSNPDLINQAKEKMASDPMATTAFSQTAQQATPAWSTPQPEQEEEQIDTSSAKRSGTGTSADPIIEEIEDLGFSSS